MKKQLIILVFLLLSNLSYAGPVLINGVYYTLNSKTKTAEVTKPESTNYYFYSSNVTIPATVNYGGVTYDVTSIGDDAFGFSLSLNSVSLPNSIISIGNNAFGSDYYLTSVTLPNSITSIGAGTFEGCRELKTVNIPESLTKIPEDMFDGCNVLTNITIPKGVEIIGEGAFAGCAFTSITIPNSVTTIGKRCFLSCTSLSSISIPNSVTTIGNSCFEKCSALSSVTLPNSIKEISYGCFSKCTRLESISIPNDVTIINSYAFNDCSSLKKIIIGSNVTSIDSYAFRNCMEMNEVFCYREQVPSTKNDVFSGSYIDYATLHVPASAVNAYKAADPWKNFKSIVAIDGTTPETPKCEKPTISYENGQLKMSCATEGVEYVTDITDADIKKHYDAIISLTATYNISVYATKSGYDNSETATATLCWIDVAPKTEGITNGIANIPAQAVLIQNEGGSIKVQGVDDGTQVNVYGINGTQAGSAISQSGAATINTNLQPGSIAIVKIGQKSVKVVIK